MAEELPLALRRTQRRTPKKTNTAASTRKSPRATGVAQKKPATTRAAGKKAARPTKKGKASAPESASVTAADDAADDSATLVDDADGSITALDYEAPISSSNKRKRPSTTTTTSSPQIGEEGNQRAIKKARRQTNKKNNNDNDNNNNPTVVHVVPLRTQVLDPHTIRQIRRNGLSAVQNAAYEEKRARRQKTLEELRRAREELLERDAEIERLRELTAVFGDGSEGAAGELSRLREEVEGLRRRRGAGENDDDDVELTSSPPVARGYGDDGGGDDDGWAGMDGMSDAGVSDAGGESGAREFDDGDEFGEASLAELEMGGTPGQHRRHHHQHRSTTKRPAALRLHGTTTLTPPSTSPTKMASPSPSSSCDAGVQAGVNMSNATTTTDAASQVCVPDPAMDALTEELGTLRAEVSSLSETLLERDALQARMGEKLARHHHGSSSPSSAQAEDQDQDFVLQLDIVLQDLAEKTDRLGELSALLMPPGDSTDDNNNTTNKETTAQLAAALQDVRDALAGLEAGPSTTATNTNTTTPPPPQSAAQTLLQAAARLRELDNTLKQRAAAHDALATDLAACRASEAAKEAQAANLSADVAHLADTVAALREELDAASASRQADLDAALQQKTAAAELEALLAEREGELQRLKGELAAAGETVSRLRGDAARDKARSRDAVRAMRAQMLAALRVGEGFLGDEVAKSEEADLGGGMDGEAARHRSDDSGLGLGEDQAEGGLQLV
ncbi:hypothetical protein KVR01_007236 [Diaporthe batatas]|uniref:uncharacterized protein n=1 Tax=Diaporthe batatas TaxID=748121 RepID=UPI001D039108|nr:uncharacterized protein KVR01_007236 [Diaporthe batatas]KAG8162758.1 hypothetical protein KVR01_007236 [Diaporthe batatas]